jgi:phage/plasmid-like protein (TIGR03299 family)
MSNFFNAFGKPVNEKTDIRQVIIEAGLNFEVGKELCHINILGANGVEELPVPNTYGLYRKDTGRVFTQDAKTVTNRYEIVQNSEAFDFMDSLKGDSPIEFETAGMFRQGAVIFVSARIPNNLKMLDDNDPIEDYMLFSSSHDGTGMVTVSLTPIRVVCENTLRMAIKNAVHQVKFKHTTNVHEKVKKAHTIIGMHNTYIVEMQETFLQLSKIKISDSNVQDIVNTLLLNAEQIDLLEKANGKLYAVNEISKPKRREVEAVEAYIYEGVGQTLHEGTGLWLYNGISSYVHNQMSFDDKEDKYNSIMTGNGDKLIQRTQQLLLNNN